MMPCRISKIWNDNFKEVPIMATEKKLNARLMQKSDTSANWDTASKAANPFIPLKGEIIFYTDLNRIKIGDGDHTPNDLEFIGGADGASVVPGDFLELDEDGKLNVISSYTEGGGTYTETFHTTTDNWSWDTSLSETYYLSHPVDSIVSWSMTDDGDANNGMTLKVAEDGGVYFEGYPYDDYNGDGNDISITYVSREEIIRLVDIATEAEVGVVKPGKFLDISKNGALNVSTTSNYEGGTATQTSTTFDYVDMDTYKATIYSEYPIKEVTDFQYNVYGSWESTSGYTISADRRSISYSYGPCSQLYIKATYSYDAGELSLFDGIEKMTVKSSMYGTTLPSSGQEGQVFFLLK